MFLLSTVAAVNIARDKLDNLQSHDYLSLDAGVWIAIGQYHFNSYSSVNFPLQWVDSRRRHLSFKLSHVPDDAIPPNNTVCTGNVCRSYVVILQY